MTSAPPVSETSSPRTILLCFIVAMLEGFDIQAAGVAAPKMADMLSISPGLLGAFFSSSTVGMLLGAFVCGRLSDRLGRKPILLVAVLLFGACSLLTAFAASAPALIAARFATGLGLGGALPVIVSLVSENNPARQTRAVALMYAGTPLGGAIAGIGSALFESWQAIFIVGGILPIAVLPLLALFLPESRPPAVPGQPGRQNISLYHALFADGRALATLNIWGAFFFAMLVLYLMLNWTPTLLAEKQFSSQLIGIFQALVNVAGALVVMFASSFIDDRRIRPMVIVAYGGAAIMLVAVAGLPAQIALVAIVATLFGGALLSAQSLLYATAPRIYPQAARGTGVGAAIGMGRTGSVLGPLAAAAILSLGASAAQVMLAIAPLMIIAGIFNLLALRKPGKRPA